MLRSYCFAKIKPGHLQQQLKKHATLLQAVKTSLEGYKNSYFDSYSHELLVL